MSSSKKTHINGHKLSPESMMLHHGYDPKLSEGAVKCPQFQTSTFVFESAQHGKDFFNYASGRVEVPEGVEPGLIYSRFNNPVLEILEGRIALWDEAEDCLVTGSGMAAISTTVLALSKPGDVVIYAEPIYGGTDTLLNGVLSQYNLQAVGFNSSEGHAALAQALEKAKTMGDISVVLMETPDNPTNQMIDIQACKDLLNAQVNNSGEAPVLAIDNTMYGPIFQQPLQLGADLCIYSLTKYMGGHSDLLGGSCSGSKALINRIRGFRNIIGTNMDSHTAWLVMRSLETLKIRMTASAQGAEQVVDYLQSHPLVQKIYYPGLLTSDDEQYAIFKKQCSGCASTFSFTVKGGEAQAFKVLDSMQMAMLAVSLGGTETLVQHPASMTHSSVPADRRQQIGVTDNLIRISVGIENPQDIIADLSQALAKIA
ncbi:cystathionine gamma-synthase family protein [Gammaproteobacteria bacterium AS21]